MGSNEDYLDSLLRSVNGENPSGGAAPEKQTNIRNEEGDTAKETESGNGFSEDLSDAEIDSEELDFPELARLFGEEPEEELVEEVSAADMAVEKEGMITPAEEGAGEKEDIEYFPAATENADADQEESGETFLLSDQGTEETELLPEEEEVTAGESEPEAEGALFQSDEEMEDAIFRSGAEMGDTDLDLEDMGSLSELDIADLEALMSPELSEETAETFEPETEPDAVQDVASVGMMDSLDEDHALAEISELLDTSDGGGALDEDDDMKSLMESLTSGGTEEDADSPDILNITDDDVLKESDDPGEKKGLFSGRKKRNKKEKKEKSVKEPSVKGPGIFKRLFAFLMDEEELDDILEEKSQLDLSEENIAILEGLEKEDGKPGKKNKKAKPPKEKKPKEKKPKEKKPKQKKPKKEKKPKPKKEKKPKPPKEPEKPLKPIGKKKIITTVIFALTVFGMIMVFTSYIPGTIERQEGRKAFQAGDYKKAYELLITKKVKGSEEGMLNGATLYLQMERKLESYENYGQLAGMEVEQLHALISGVDKYRTIQAEAEQYGVSEPVRSIYLDILSILQSQYGISEEQAQELALITDSVAYTKELKRILGQEVTDILPEAESGPEPMQEPEAELPDEEPADLDVESLPVPESGASEYKEDGSTETQQDGEESQPEEEGSANTDNGSQNGAQNSDFEFTAEFIED